MTPLRWLAELSTITTVYLLALVPWHQIPYLPPPALLLSVAVGAALAVVCIPDSSRTIRLSITTALAGMAVGLLATDVAIELLKIESVAMAKAIAGLMGFGGLPITGLATRFLNEATNDPTHWLGQIAVRILPPARKPDAEPATGRTVPPASPKP